jgi:hypothetical protein
VSSPAPLPGSSLPDENYLVQRLGGLDPQKAQSMTDFFAQIVPICYQLLADELDSAIPSSTFYGERIVISGSLPRALPGTYPIISLNNVLLYGSSPLRVGRPVDIAIGNADVAISSDGGSILLGSWFCAPPFELYVDYAAGYDVLPNDLLEVFVEMASLIWKEKDRVGQTQMKIDVGTATYVRKLPQWCQNTIRRYRRMEIYR